MGAILENVFNSVTDKLNFILQPLAVFTHLLVTKWLPGEAAVTGVCQYYSFSLVGALKY